MWSSKYLYNLLFYEYYESKKYTISVCKWLKSRSETLNSLNKKNLIFPKKVGKSKKGVSWERHGLL